MAASASAEVTCVRDGRVSPGPPHCLCVCPFKILGSSSGPVPPAPHSPPFSSLLPKRRKESLWGLGDASLLVRVPFMFLREWIHLLTTCLHLGSSSHLLGTPPSTPVRRQPPQGGDSEKMESLGSAGRSPDTLEAVSQWASPCPCRDLPLPKLERRKKKKQNRTNFIFTSGPLEKGVTLSFHCALPEAAGRGGPRGAWREGPSSSGKTGALCLEERETLSSVPLAVTLVLPECFYRR